MIDWFIIILLIEFFVAAFFSFILRGAINVRKAYVYLDEGLGFLFIIIVSIFVWKFGTFQFINELFAFLLSIVFLAILLIVFVFVVGIETGNFLERIILRRKRK